MNENETREWFCAHCLETTKTLGRMSSRPDECPHCRVGFCRACGTRLKQDVKFCHGCAVILPDVKACMYSTSSIGGAYAAENWAWDGLPEGQPHIFKIASGWKTPEALRAEEPGSRWITKRSRDGSLREDVRDLSDDEWSLMSSEDNHGE